MIKLKTLILLLFLIFGCKSLVNKTVKKELSLTQVEYNKIKKDSLITNTLYRSIKDSVKISVIEKRLDSFFLGSYVKKELISILEVDRVFKGKLNIEFKKDFDTLNAIEFNNTKDLKNFMVKVKKRLNGEDIIIEKPNQKKDSL